MGGGWPVRTCCLSPCALTDAGLREGPGSLSTDALRSRPCWPFSGWTALGEQGAQAQGRAGPQTDAEAGS